MRKDGKSGSARQPRGPPAERKAFAFEASEAAFRHLLGRGHSKEQIAALVRAAETGVAIASVVQAIITRSWILGAHGPVSKTLDMPADPVRHHEHMKEVLGAPVEFAMLAEEMIETADRLVGLAQKVQAIRDANPTLTEDATSWSSEKQVLAASVLAAASKLGIELDYRDLEAVALLSGTRPGGEDLPTKPELSPEEYREQLLKLARERPESFAVAMRHRLPIGGVLNRTVIERAIAAEIDEQSTRIKRLAERYRSQQKREGAWATLLKQKVRRGFLPKFLSLRVPKA